MACEGSPALAELRVLEERKVPIILCATSLAFYELEEKVRTGIVAGMGDIIAAQQADAGRKANSATVASFRITVSILTRSKPFGEIPFRRTSPLQHQAISARNR